MNESPIKIVNKTVRFPLKKSALVATLAAVLTLLGITYYGYTKPLPIREPQIAKNPIVVGMATSTPSELTYAYTQDPTVIPYGITIPKTELPVLEALLASTTVRTSTDKYRLFIDTGPESPDHAPFGDSVSYFDDGYISSGKYAGYHRVIAQYPIDGIDIVPYYNDYLATKDYRTFIVYRTTPDQVPNPGFVNTKAIVAADTFPIDFPEKPIKLNGAFSLTLSGIFSTTSPLKGSVTLAAPVSTFNLYSEPATPETVGFQTYEEYGYTADEIRSIEVDPSPYVSAPIASSTSKEYLAFKDTVRKYISGSTRLTARDSSGISFTYDLAFTNFSDFTNIQGQKPAGAPGYPGSYGNLEVDPSGLVPQMYSFYGDLFPRGCGDTGNTTLTLKNISDKDVIDTGRSWQGVELYAFSHPQAAPIVQALYYMKKSGNAHLEPDTSTGIFTDPLPAYKDYIKKYPMLLFKDPWGRWVGVGEHDYIASGGCGKPVVYLYPPKPTAVTVQFTKVPSFRVDIPTYSNGWKVLAQSNGTLTDLQPEKTLCDSIDSSRAGSEYAADACRKNSYPYLYWAGRANGAYPIPSGGWVVNRNDLNAFLSQELMDIGLNDQESKDMRSFWVSKLLETPAPYYRLSFFTTQQMNQFISMDISPRPKSVLRVFLDWSPLSEKPRRC
jgi:hypothetical protein